MLARTITVLIAASGVASAIAEIQEWGHDPAAQYVIEPAAETVHIYAPATYKFQAVSGSQLGNIKLIRVEESCPPGTVTLYVLRDPSEVGGDPHQPGAAEVWEIDLSGATDAQVAEFRITGDYGNGGPGVGGPLRTHGAGTVVIGSSVLDDIEISGALGALLECGWLDAEIHLSNPAAVHTGNIKVWAGSPRNVPDLAGPYRRS